MGDIQSFNGARVGSAPCLSIGGQKACVIKTAKKPSDIWQDYFTELPTYIDSDNNTQPDYWKVAQKYCEIEGGHLPSKTELTTIARVLYNDTSIPDSGETQWLTVKNKIAVYGALGIKDTTSWFSIWSDTTKDKEHAYRRDFSSYTNYGYNTRKYTYNSVICLE